MSDITQILCELESGTRQASEKLLPLVYAELRKLAEHRLAVEKPGQTLQATALVHEAYLRLVGNSNTPGWNSRGHFFKAASEAMRRILVENARRKKRIRHGGGKKRIELDDYSAHHVDPSVVLTVNDALSKLAETDDVSSEIVKLHFFSGFTLDEVADVLSLSRATVYRQWAYARAFLKVALNDVDADTV